MIDTESQSAGTSESISIEYKRRLNTKERGDWCEILKDIVAIANSGGGEVFFGLDDNGREIDAEAALKDSVDPVEFTNKLSSYTSASLPDLQVVQRPDYGDGVWALRIGSAKYPIVFEKEGSYDQGPGKPKIAFRVGSVYVRRAGKSQPATSSDLRDIIDRLIDIRNAALRKVIEAPLDAQLIVGVAGHVGYLGGGDSAGRAVVITDDPEVQRVYLSDDAIKEKFPYDYNAMARRVRGMVPGFKQNRMFTDAMKRIGNDPERCHTRYLNPGSRSSGFKRLYSRKALADIAVEMNESFGNSSVE